MEFDFPLIWCYLYARSYKCLNSPFKKNKTTISDNAKIHRYSDKIQAYE